MSQALQALDGFATFSNAPDLGAVTGLSSQPAKMLATRYRGSPSGRPAGLGHLPHPAEAHVTVRDIAALLSSTRHAIPRVPWGRLALPNHAVRSVRITAETVSCSHQLITGVAGGHGINGRDYSGKQRRDYSAHSPSHVTSSITSITRHTTNPLAEGSRHSLVLVAAGALARPYCKRTC